MTMSIANPDNKVHGATMGPIWGRQDPDGPYVGLMNFAIWEPWYVLWNIVLLCVVVISWSFYPGTHKRRPMMVWGVFVSSAWSIFCLCHCRAVCDTVLHWTTSYRESIVGESGVGSLLFCLTPITSFILGVEWKFCYVYDCTSIF